MPPSGRITAVDRDATSYAVAAGGRASSVTAAVSPTFSARDARRRERRRDRERGSVTGVESGLCMDVSPLADAATVVCPSPSDLRGTRQNAAELQGRLEETLNICRRNAGLVPLRRAHQRRRGQAKPRFRPVRRNQWRAIGYHEERTVAEREGFEPPIRLPVCRISSAVLSTTQPPLRERRVRANALQCCTY